MINENLKKEVLNMLINESKKETEDSIDTIIPLIKEALMNSYLKGFKRAMELSSKKKKEN